MNDGLKDKHRRAMIHILSQCDKVQRVVLFGSRAMGTFTPTSDVDIVLHGGKLTLTDQADLAEQLNELSVPQSIDVLLYHRIKSKELLRHIEDYGVQWWPEVFYKNTEAERVVLQKKAEKKVLPEGWEEKTLSEIVNLIGGGTPKRSIEEYWNGNIPWLSVKDFNNEYRHVDYTEQTITKLGLQKSSTKILEKGQLIISARGTVGMLAQLSHPMAFNQSCYGIDVKNKYTENNFLYYLIKYSVGHLKQITHGAVFDTITRETFNHIIVNLPPLPEQKAIAHILGSLDDKIELNRRMNETLEAMAQALFTSFFVDFDPVIDNALAAGNEIPEELKERAKIRKALGHTRKPLPEEIRNLFPSEFEYTEEMGWIPKGWKAVTLDDLVDLIGGGTPKTSTEEYWNGSVPWFSVVDAPNTSDVFVIDTEKHITELGVEKSSTNILPAGTTIISARGTVGKCAIVGKPMAMNQFCYGVRGKKKISDSFVYYAIREKVSDLQRGGHGSVFNTITRDTFKTIKIAFGKPNLSEKLEDRIKPIFNRILANRFSSETLSNLRDTLLPKLLSGEIRIPDAEKLAEDLDRNGGGNGKS